MRFCGLLIGGALLVWTGAAQAQAGVPLAAALAERESRPLLPRWMPTRDLDAALRCARLPLSGPLRLVLKLQDGCGASARSGRLLGQDPGLRALARSLEQTPGAKLRPYFAAHAPEQLERMRLDGQRRSGRALADLEQFYLLELPAGSDARAWLGQLLASASVENAYVAPSAVAPGAAPVGDFEPSTPDFTALQEYQGPAPLGVDMQFAWSLPGTRGKGLQVCDIENGWDLQHEDLSKQPPGALIGLPQADPNETDHGTAVAGILVADDDATGVRGLVPEARLRVASASTSEGYDLAGAILLAASVLGEGDVILVEQQAIGPNTDGFLEGQFGLVAPEILDAEFAAMQTATALGLHVLEIACNGLQNYDSDQPPVGHPELKAKFDPRLRDSGALMCGAAQSLPPHSKMWFSNYGLRLDAYAWGQNVATLGFDAMPGYSSGDDLHQRYILNFAGTSSATPIVTGCVLALEGRHRLLYGESYPQRALRLLLRTTGTPTALASEPLGQMPDLAQQLPLLESGPRLASVFQGAQAAAQLGAAVAHAGDLDGDLWGDLWIASSAAGSPSATGRISARSGLTGVELWSVAAGDEEQAFGSSMLALLDRNGDGRRELAVSLSLGKFQDQWTGSVRVLSGADGAPLTEIVGDQEGAQFGAALAELPDLDQDGLAELAIGAPAHLGAAGTQPGAGWVGVYASGSGSLLWEVEGLEGDALGSSLARVGDLDGDLIEDLAVGAPGASVQASGAGALCLYSGASGELLWRLDGAHPQDALGAALVRTGDLDGDGRADLVVGLPGASSQAEAAGAVQWRTLAGVLYQSVQGLQPGARLGSKLAAVDSLWGVEPFPQVWASAPQPDGLAVGRVLRLASSGAMLEERRGLAPGDGFGLALCGSGDIDADGNPDLLVGAPHSSGPAGEFDQGLVLVSLGQSAAPLLPGEAPLVAFGTGTPGCAGQHVLWAQPLPRVGEQDFHLECTSVSPWTAGLGVISGGASVEGSDPFALGCLFHVDISDLGGLILYPVLSDASGLATHPLPIPLDLNLVGQTFVTQMFWPWPIDPPACWPLPSWSSLSSTPGLSLRIEPPL